MTMLPTKLLVLFSAIVFVSGQGITYYGTSNVRNQSRPPPHPLTLQPTSYPNQPDINPRPVYVPPPPIVPAPTTTSNPIPVYPIPSNPYQPNPPTLQPDVRPTAISGGPNSWSSGIYSRPAQPLAPPRPLPPLPPPSPSTVAPVPSSSPPEPVVIITEGPSVGSNNLYPQPINTELLSPNIAPRNSFEENNLPSSVSPSPTTTTPSPEVIVVVEPENSPKPVPNESIHPPSVSPVQVVQPTTRQHIIPNSRPGSNYIRTTPRPPPIFPPLNPPLRNPPVVNPGPVIPPTPEIPQPNYPVSTLPPTQKPLPDQPSVNEPLPEVASPTPVTSTSMPLSTESSPLDEDLNDRPISSPAPLPSPEEPSIIPTEPPTPSPSEKPIIPIQPPNPNPEPSYPPKKPIVPPIQPPAPSPQPLYPPVEPIAPLKPDVPSPTPTYPTPVPSTEPPTSKPTPVSPPEEPKVSQPYPAPRPAPLYPLPKPTVSPTSRPVPLYPPNDQVYYPVQPPSPPAPTYPPTTTTNRPPAFVPTTAPLESKPLIGFTCNRGNGYYAIAEQCDSYVECQKNQAWQMYCPDGLHFNPNAAYPDYPCAYPSEVKCTGSSTKQLAHPTSECPRQYGFFSTSDGDCSKYIMCQEGKATLMNCPLGLVFNDALSSCDWPENVPQCNPNAFRDFTCPAPPVDSEGNPSDIIFKYKYGTHCKMYLACQRGHPRLLRCDSGMSFDEKSQACIDSDLVPECSMA